ncbi:MAG: ABC transporter ATP-binding protein [Acidobacteria bacterium]|nr:ABC transporter ATP-binding protein [Acidobacteriota bacterium]
MLAIETEGLTKDYQIGFWRPRPYRALHELTLAVEQGEVYGFLGPNGAGKSTAIKLLMQLIYPTSGTARILGRPVGDVDIRRRIGFLPENPSFYDYLTAEELLSYFASLFDVPSAERAIRVSRVLDQVGIGAERRMRLRSYSKGMVQRVGIAQAIINDPEVVFFDEPMSGLDPLGRRDVRQLLLGLRDRGCTVFFSSHILSDAEALCSRVAIIAQGRLAGGGRLSDIVGVDVLGWELVADGVNAAALDLLRARARSVTALHDGRYTVDLPPAAPEETVQALAAAGGRVVSLNPVRHTLEDYFVQHVSQAATREAAL